MKHFHGIHLAALLAAMTCVSCNPDPALVERSAQQQIEISRLKAQLAALESQIDACVDPGPVDLEQTTKQSKALAAELEDTKQELAEITARKQSLQEEFDAFRAKHPLD